jgi:gliding motility-associated-like protein
VADLDDVTAECSVDSLTAPTATDNCSGSITGTTTTVLPITDQGTTVVTWTYVDTEGNVTTQTQTIVIIDTLAPVADVAALADVTAQCSVDSLTAPTATDNCSGSITGTTTTAFPITAQGVTEVTWTYVDAEGNISTQTQNVVIEDIDNLDALNDNYIICNDLDNGGLGYITLSPEIADPNYTFIWRDEFGNILSQQSTYQINEGGTYSLEIYYPGCTAIIELFTVTEIEAITATVEIITEDFSINNEVVITPTSNGTYEFSLDQGVWQDNNTFTNISPGIHTIYIQDIRGCGMKTYIIYILDYPRFFTPNGDGYNDIWNVNTLSNQAESRIHIFDRYGKLIKQIRPAGNGWDGTYNGQMMPTNDYWFVLYYNDLTTGEPKQFRSHFTLKR